jgi:hypothetical protein
LLERLNGKSQIAVYRQQNEDLRVILRSQIQQVEIYKQMLIHNTSIADQLSKQGVDITITNILENKQMSDNIDQSRKIQFGNVGRDVTATGTAFNLGDIDISGQVINSINQLPDEPISTEQPGIKELLTQLQKVIEDSTELSPGEKIMLLEQVKALAEAQLAKEPESKKGLVQKAKGMFEAILKGLPDTAKIVESIGQLLPMLLKAVGLSA